ncbi:putative peroxin 26 [Diaporthe ampelina]|uniref:Putative peroxin 26 n=1 Tax=Diaporthe ampelina TaxID=1214573 RepID=A0A0G2HKC5_9PEZI|nr:putative peroxin 26 [Diaporthe ampelina]
MRSPTGILTADDGQSLPRKSINAILITAAAPLKAQKACSDLTMASPATNGAYTATLSPTSTGGFASQSLRSSISSLSSPAAARHAASYVSKTYRQSSTLFLTRRLPEALSTITPLITVTPPSPSQPEGANGTTTEPAPVAKASRNTRIKVWTLYIAILNAIVALDPDEGKEALGTQEWRALCAKVRDGDVWEEVVQNGYHGVEADVDSDVVINLATLLLTHARTQTLNQKRLENYLAASATPNLDLSGHFSPAQQATPRGGGAPPARPRSQSRARSGADTPRDLNARVKILELYTLHVLIRNNEWEYAREFISVSSVLDEERREAFLQALQSLQEDQLEAERKERDEKLRQEEQLRRDIEEARRLRAENEGRETRRLEEERARRRDGGSEVDYGIDAGGASSSAGGSSAGRGASKRARAQTGGSSRSSRPSRPSAAASGGGTSPNKSKAVAPASLGARAAVVFANVRAMIDRMSVTLHTNPMLLMRLLAFIIGLVVMFGKKNMRERISRILGTSWNKVKATAGMGVKVSYI